MNLIDLADPTPTCSGEDCFSNTNLTPGINSLGDLPDTFLTIAGILYFLVIAGVVGYLGKSFLQYASARQQGYTEKVTEAAKDIKHALGGLVGLAILPILVQGILKLKG